MALRPSCPKGYVELLDTRKFLGQRKPWGLVGLMRKTDLIPQHGEQRKPCKNG